MSFIRLLPIALCVSVLAACTSTHTNTSPATISDNPPQPASHFDMEKIRYECVNFEPIEVRYFPHHGVAVLVLDGITHELQEEVVASGFGYSNGMYGLRGKGSELDLTIGRRAPIACIAVL